MGNTVPIGVCVAAAAVAGLAAAAVVLLVCKQLEKRRIQSARAREQELLERLAGGLAHEIKNPLGALNLNVQLLEEELDAAGALAEASRSRLATIKKEYRRLEGVLDDFLRYASRRELSLSDVDINTLITDLCTFVKPEFHMRGVELACQFAPLPLCRADANLLKQALLNIILNALEAISGRGAVRITTRAEGDTIAIEVGDTGTGIKQENLPRIFDAYFTTKKTGTGLGLAVARRIVEDHGGRISVDSAPGTGTTFTVSLPAGH